MDRLNKTIQKPRSLVFCTGSSTKRERLIYNYFMLKLKEDKKVINEKLEFYKSKNMIFDGHTIELTIKELAKNTAVKDIEDLTKIVTNFQNVSLNIDVLDVKSKRFVPVIGEVRINEDSIIQAHFPSTIVESVMKFNNYVSFTMNDLIKLKSKYSVILFEIVKSYYRENQSLELPKISIEDFKELMGIKTNQYKNLNDLKRRVLDVAAVDVTNQTEFIIEYTIETNRLNNKYICISFTNKNDEKNITKEPSKEELINGLKNLSTEELLKIIEEKKDNSFIQDLIKTSNKVESENYKLRRQNEKLIDLAESKETMN